MTRGEIRYITRDNTIGAEIWANGRPAVIVSAPGLEQSPVQLVVYLTTQPRAPRRTHVAIHSSGRESVAICEQVTTVSIECIGDICGRCTDSEMAAIEDAMAAALGIQTAAAEPDQEYPVDCYEELVQARAELAASERFIVQLLDRLVGRGAR